MKQNKAHLETHKELDATRAKQLKLEIEVSNYSSSSSSPKPNSKVKKLKQEERDAIETYKTRTVGEVNEWRKKCALKEKYIIDHQDNLRVLEEERDALKRTLETNTKM